MKTVKVDNGDGSGNIVVYVDGQLFNATSEHPNYGAIIRAVEEDNEEGIENLFDVGKALEHQFTRLGDRLAVRGEDILFDGDVLRGSIADHILRHLNAGDEESWVSLVLFFEKVMQNPKKHSREQLFDWLEKHDFTITDEGNIIMYRGVTADFKSSSAGPGIVNGEKVNGKHDNRPGTIVEMARSDVNHNPAAGCSKGLHCASWDYASGWATKTVAVIVHPRDVVSVPTESNWEKVRVCKYIVKSEVTTEAPTSKVYLREDDEGDWDF